MRKRQLTNERFLNFFKDEKGYTWVERVNSAPTVTILPIYKEKSEQGNEGKTTEREYYCFIKEFRPSIKGYIYQLPAGLVDSGETPIIAARRELKEEIGATALSIEEITCGYTSVGLCTEYAIMYIAEVELGESCLQEGEDITLIKVEREKVREFIAIHKKDFCLRSAQLALLALALN